MVVATTALLVGCSRGPSGPVGSATPPPASTPSAATASPTAAASATASPAARPDLGEGRPGPVLLVPGYGGATAALEPLAAALRTTGRTATVVDLPGDGTGDLRLAAEAVGRAADAAVRTAGAGATVDVVGYSAGGVVARVWVAEGGPALRVRRVVTLGAPHHGTGVAALALAVAPERCPQACRQLAPGSPLLAGLPETPAGPAWVSVWTDPDQLVTPATSARLDGAVDVPLATLCPGAGVTHQGMPSDLRVVALVVAALSGDDLEVPTACPEA